MDSVYKFADVASNSCNANPMRSTSITIQSKHKTKAMIPMPYRPNSSTVDNLPTFNDPMMQQMSQNVHAILQGAPAFLNTIPVPAGYSLKTKLLGTPIKAPPSQIVSPGTTVATPFNHHSSTSAQQSPPMPTHPPIPTHPPMSQNHDTFTCTSPDKFNQVGYDDKAPNKAELPKPMQKRKRRQKSNDNNEPNVYKYHPLQDICAHKNIDIPHQLLKSTTNAKFDKIKCHLDHKTNRSCKHNGLYSWMDVDIAIQFDNNYSNKDIKIFNHGRLDENTNEDCYSVVEVVNEEKSSKHHRLWKMKGKLFSKKTILRSFAFPENRLPSPVRETPKFKSELLQKKAITDFLMNSEKMHELIEKTKWNKVQVFSKLNNKRRMVLKITQYELQNDLRKSQLLNNEDVELIPIILYVNKHYTIHYVTIVTINGSNVGLSMIYDNASTSVKISGFHIDALMIHIQHQWVSLEHLQECNHKSLNHFVSHIDHLRIGNVDEDANKIKALRKQLKSNKQKDCKKQEN